MKTLTAFLLLCIASLTSGCMSGLETPTSMGTPCHDTKHVGVYPVQNGYYSPDPTIAEFISAGRYSVIGYQVAPGGTCLVTVQVDGHERAASYSRTVQVIGL